MAIKQNKRQNKGFKTRKVSRTAKKVQDKSQKSFESETDFYTAISTYEEALIMQIINSRKTNIVSSSAVVSSTALVQGLVVGCGCTSPVIFGVFGVVLGSAAATYLDIFLSNNQIPIFLVLIAINLSMSWYYLNKLSSKSCRVKKQ